MRASEGTTRTWLEALHVQKILQSTGCTSMSREIELRASDLQQTYMKLNKFP